MSLDRDAIKLDLQQRGAFKPACGLGSYDTASRRSAGWNYSPTFYIYRGYNRRSEGLSGLAVLRTQSVAQPYCNNGSRWHNDRLAWGFPCFGGHFVAASVVAAHRVTWGSRGGWVRGVASSSIVRIIRRRL